MMKQKFVPIVSIVIGILAFFFTSHYLHVKERDLEKERQALYKGARKIRVVAARRDIPSGTVLKRDDLGSREVHEGSVRDNVVLPQEADLLLDKKVTFAIKEDDPILWSDIAGGLTRESSLAPAITQRMRAISIAVSGAAAVSGMIEPNDRVDILGTFNFPSESHPGEMETVTLTMLQDVTVLATGQQLAKDRLGDGRRTAARRGYGAVTVEVTPREAELLVFAQHMRGNLTLSLRHPDDISYETDLPEIDFEQLENSLQDLNMYRQKEIRHKRQF